MQSRNPTELIEKVQKEKQRRSEVATDALQWFMDGNVQELFPRSGVVNKLCQELNITQKEANRAISDTVGDIVDPVQQVVSQSKKYVGIIEYSAYEDEGAYRYIDYDDVLGKRKRVVCAKCVAESDVDADVTHATEGEGSTSDNMPWDVLLNKVITHYEDAHTTAPKTVTPGASLLNGTTISGNTSFHTGNESTITASNAQLTPSSLELTSIGGIISFLGGFDISSARFLQSFDVSGPSSRPRDITFNPSGTKMFIIGSSSDKVFQYPLDTAFDISTASGVGQSIDVSNNGPFSPRGVAFSNDGLKMFPIGDSNDAVFEFTLSSGFDVGTASNDAFRFFDVSGQSKDPEGVTFNDDGTKMFVIDRAGASVNTAFAYQYSLSTAFDISTASYNSVKLDVTSQESSPKSLAFNDDGTKMFVTGSSSNSIFEYKMNSSFDIGTASYTGTSLDVSQQDGAPQGVRFKPDGKSMFIVGNQSDSVHQYLLGNVKIK